MTRLGVDYAFPPHPRPSALRAAGYTWASRYLGGSASKDLTPAERDALWAAGLDIVCNWESAAGAAKKGRAQGVADAKAALRQANALGVPSDRPIYFSYDFGPPYSWAVIEGYAAGVVSVLGVTRAGAYGGYDLIEHLRAKGLAAWFWQTYAWSSGRWSSAAHIRQVQNGITVDGADCDRDQAMAVDFGQWGVDMALNSETIPGTAAGLPKDRTADVCLSDLWNEELLGHSGLNPKDKSARQLQLDRIEAALTALTAGAGLTDTQVSALADKVATALIASGANGLTPADHAAIVADVQAALRAGTGAAS